MNIVFFATIIILATNFVFLSRHTMRKSEADISPRRLTQSSVEDMAQHLCSRIAQSKATVTSSIGYESAPGKNNPRLQFWEVTCQAKGDSYSIEINPESSEVLLFRHELETTIDSVASSSDALSHRVALYYSRRYLDMLGLPLSKNANLIVDKPGYSFVFQSTLPAGRTRLVQVCVNRFDGTLESVRNFVYHPTQKNSIPLTY